MPKNPEQRKNWEHKNKEKLRLYYADHRLKPKRRYQIYKASAQIRSLEWNITFEEFCSFWQQPCSYCGDLIETIGLDRTEPTLGYTLNNIVPCCKICNYMKHISTSIDFIKKCEQITNYLKVV